MLKNSGVAIVKATTKKVINQAPKYFSILPSVKVTMVSLKPSVDYVK
jgi:hypothetical protein